MRGRRIEGKQTTGESRRAARPATKVDSSVSKRVAGSGRRAATGSQVRIIGGRWKRTPLPVADAAGLRPTPDRVRETLFNWLTHWFGELAGVRGLDLFAGTGALGLELASRGAARVTLVDSNAALVARIRGVGEKLGAHGVDAVTGDALAVARGWPDGTFDIVFVDPPFDSGLLEPSLREAARLTRSDGVVYAESGAPLDPELAASLGLAVVRSGRAGQVRFHLLQRA
jgi:16S rRNA (guanine(966)-N(2))-methyltransferase RsmD